MHCANFSDLKNAAVFYAIDHKLSHGLIRSGHFVYNFSYRDIAKTERRLFSKRSGRNAMLKRLAQCMANLQPDLLLLGHSELITAQDLAHLREQFPSVKVGMWWVDWIHNLKPHLDKLAYVDHFFMTTNPSELAPLGLAEHTLAKCSFMPNMCDRAIDRYRAFDAENYNYDIVFVGRYDAERAPLIEHLSRNYSQYKLGIFGQTRASLVFGDDFYQVLANARIALNYSRANSFSLYSSDRLIQPVANGVLTLSAHFPDIEQLFTAKQVPTFTDFQSLDQLLVHYLNDDADRRATAKAAHQHAHKHYEATIVAQSMLATLFSEHRH